MWEIWRPPPGFEPGLQAPQACTLPDSAVVLLYVTAAARFNVRLYIFDIYIGLAVPNERFFPRGD